MSSYHSQFGEDRWIVENLPLPPKGVFVEVGAFDGVASSNTLFFEEEGWTGICIEPDPEIADRCNHNRKAFTFTCAIGSVPGESYFHVNDQDRGTSGLVRPETGRKIVVPVVRLDYLLDLWKPGRIDLLSVDTEGTESDVLRSLGSWRPTIIVAEFWSQPQTPRLDELDTEAFRIGYRRIHQTVANAIYVPNTLNNWP